MNRREVVTLSGGASRVILGKNGCAKFSKDRRRPPTLTPQKLPTIWRSPSKLLKLLALPRGLEPLFSP
jgi:hypothetical protein